jgi:hypothetical protein
MAVTNFSIRAAAVFDRGFDLFIGNGVTHTNVHDDFLNTKANENNYQ